MRKIIKYKKDFDYSYTSGAYITVELLKTHPNLLEAVYIHTSFTRLDEINVLCEENGISIICNDTVFKRINQKENTYVLGVFKKYHSDIKGNKPHVVLVNPNDMGNLGTIIRTLAGFGIYNLAIINPAADIWDPKTIRASMGALFHMNFRHFQAIEEYLKLFPEHQLYTFMLDGKIELKPGNIEKSKLYSLIFGNEASGLSERYHHIGTSIKLPQTETVDSLNLSAAVAVGAYYFTVH